MSIAINTPIIGKEEIASVTSILKGGMLTSAANKGGKHVQNFEKSVSSFVKSRYTVAVNSGTAALQAALYALNIGVKDEVLIPSFTFVATANAIVSTGAKPVFVDINPENYTIDVEEIKKKITKKTRAIIPVHLYGNIADTEEIAEISTKYGIPIIEDAAQSLGSKYKNKHTGTFFEMGCYSMYPAKVMTAGEGGFIVTNSKELHDKLLMIRNHGMRDGYDTRILGLNMRLPEISAAIAHIQLKKLPDFLIARRKNAMILSELINDIEQIKIPSERKHEKVNWYLYTIATKKRDLILRRLNTGGIKKREADRIGAVAYYSTPVHKTPFYHDMNHQRVAYDSLPNTEMAASKVLSLPVHPKVTKKNLQTMSRIIHETLA